MPILWEVLFAKIIHIKWKDNYVLHSFFKPFIYQLCFYRKLFYAIWRFSAELWTNPSLRVILITIFIWLSQLKKFNQWMSWLFSNRRKNVCKVCLLFLKIVSHTSILAYETGFLTTKISCGLHPTHKRSLEIFGYLKEPTHVSFCSNFMVQVLCCGFVVSIWKTYTWHNVTLNYQRP